MAHPRLHAGSTPEKTAYVMSDGSGSLSYKRLEVRANQGARLLRSHGLKRGDVVAFWLQNCLEAMEYYWATQRAGLYVTPLATHLSPLEADYILQNSGTKLVVICDSLAQADDLPRHDGTTYLSRSDWTAGLAGQPSEPLKDESPGFHLVYSSGTTGRPKGVRLPLPEGEVTAASFYAQMANRSFGIDASDIYLSVAPLYHTAPLLYAANAVRLGATVVIMPRFDPEAVLAAIERYNITVTQMVPTMFVRLLKLLPELRVSNDLSTLRCVIHAAAPCPVPIKHQMIEWLGPILYEYYGASEGNGSTLITPEEWLQKPGSVGRPRWGVIHICDDDGVEFPTGIAGTVYFESDAAFHYLGDEEKTRESRHPRHDNWTTVGDVGYLDDDGYLFLTDRKHFMIISGGVNVYPQEVENLLVTHPVVADVAVIGVPNTDLGEEVRAVVQTVLPAQATPALAVELMQFCRASLSPVKCPRAIEFTSALPRLDNGKLYKQAIRDRYWAGALPK